MKKIIVLTAFCSLFALVLNAQIEDKPVRFGVYGNAGTSWNSSEKAGAENAGLGFLFGYGVQLEYYKNKTFGFVFGISQKSSRSRIQYTEDLEYTYKFTKSNGDEETSKDFIDARSFLLYSVNVPFKIKARTPEIGFLTYFIEVGVDNDILYESNSVKINVKDDLESNTSARLEGERSKLSATDETLWYRGGINFGAGFEYNLVGTTSLFTNINYSLPITRTLKKESTEITWNENDKNLLQNIKTHRLFLTAGIIF